MGVEPCAVLFEVLTPEALASEKRQHLAAVLGDAPYAATKLAE